MGSLPLHAALVHVPLGLAAVMPFVAAAVALALWRGKASRRTWLVVVGLQAALVAGGLAAMRSGGAEEERVERVVAEQPIERHEEAAEAFLWGAACVLVVSATVLAVPVRVARYGALATTVAMLGVAGLGFRAGHAGGALVYRHNAASAYAAGGQGPESRGTVARAGATDEDDDHERR